MSAKDLPQEAPEASGEERWDLASRLDLWAEDATRGGVAPLIATAVLRSDLRLAAAALRERDFANSTLAAPPQEDGRETEDALAVLLYAVGVSELELSLAESERGKKSLGDAWHQWTLPADHPIGFSDRAREMLRGNARRFLELLGGARLSRQEDGEREADGVAGVLLARKGTDDDGLITQPASALYDSPPPDIGGEHPWQPTGVELLRSIAGDYAIRGNQEDDPVLRREWRRREREMDRIADAFEGCVSVEAVLAAVRDGWRESCLPKGAVTFAEQVGRAMSTSPQDNFEDAVNYARARLAGSPQANKDGER